MGCKFTTPKKKHYPHLNKRWNDFINKPVPKGIRIPPRPRSKPPPLTRKPPRLTPQPTTLDPVRPLRRRLPTLRRPSLKLVIYG